MDSSELWQEPNFAVLCSFFNKFGTLLGLKPLSFVRLESTLVFDKDGRVDKELIDLHVSLLRKAGLKTSSNPKWENALMKFCGFHSSLQAEMFQVERFGYAHTSLATKLEILKTLCERQFDLNPKFKEQLTDQNGRDLRLLPVGSDMIGQSYWYQVDADLNVRVYSEEFGDSSGATWTIRAKSRGELHDLIATLRSEQTAGSAATEGESLIETAGSLDSDSESTRGSASLCGNVKVTTLQQDGSAGNQRTHASKSSENAESLKRSETSSDVGDVSVEEIPKQSSAKFGKARQGIFVDTFQMQSPSPRGKEGRGRGRCSAGSSQKSTDPGEDVIPDDVKPFLVERRVQPLRTRKKATMQEKLEPSSEESTSESEQDWAHSDEALSADSSDTDFIPLSRLRSVSTSPRKKRPRGSDSEEEVKKKERKVADDDSLCKKCSKSDKPEFLLLCDKCDAAWHTWCLRPPLWFVPDDDWFCPKCQHTMLVDKLSLALEHLDESLKVQAAQQKKKVRETDRLKRELEFVGISLANIIPAEENSKSSEPNASAEGSGDSAAEEGRRRKVKVAKREYIPVEPLAKTRSRRAVHRVDYCFKDYDDLIEEAVDNVGGANDFSYGRGPVRPSGAGRGKDMANILQANSQRLEAACASAANTGAPHHTAAATVEEDRNAGELKIDRDEADADGLELRNHEARPPGSHMSSAKTGTTMKHHKHKLTDLDVDNWTESETDSYKASNDSGSWEEPSAASDSDWEDEQPTRRSTRLRRAREDKDFVCDDSDEERPKQKTKKKRQRGSRRSVSSGSEDSLIAHVKHSRRRCSDESGSSESSWRASDDDYKSRRRRSNAKASRKPQKKTKSRKIASSSDSEHEPISRTRGKKVNYKELEERGADFGSDAEEAEPVATTERRHKKGGTGDESDADSAEWKPNESDQEEEDDEIEEEGDVAAARTKEDERYNVGVRWRRTNRIESSDSSSGEQEVGTKVRKEEDAACDKPVEQSGKRIKHEPETARVVHQPSTLERPLPPTATAVKKAESTAESPRMNLGDNCRHSPRNSPVTVTVTAATSSPSVNPISALESMVRPSSATNTVAMQPGVTSAMQGSAFVVPTPSASTVQLPVLRQPVPLKPHIPVGSHFSEPGPVGSTTEYAYQSPAPHALAMQASPAVGYATPHMSVIHATGAAQTPSSYVTRGHAVYPTVAGPRYPSMPPVMYAPAMSMPHPYAILPPQHIPLATQTFYPAAGSLPQHIPPRLPAYGPPGVEPRMETLGEAPTATSGDDSLTDVLSFAIGNN